MANEPRYVMVTTTVDDQDAATRISKALLAPHLVPCIQSSVIRSAFWWKGKLENTDETRLQMKIPATLVKPVMAAIRAVHPYETPEIIVTPILDGDPAYLAWIDTESRPPASPTA